MLVIPVAASSARSPTLRAGAFNAGIEAAWTVLLQAITQVLARLQEYSSWSVHRVVLLALRRLDHFGDLLALSG